LSQVTDMQYMFYDAAAFEGSLNWCVLDPSVTVTSMFTNSACGSEAACGFEHVCCGPTNTNANLAAAATAWVDGDTTTYLSGVFYLYFARPCRACTGKD